MFMADVVVIGGGIIGAATAWQLAREGMRVTATDRALSVGGTSSGGEGNLLVSDRGPSARRLIERLDRGLKRPGGVHLRCVSQFDVLGTNGSN